jgi:hypothetical protein
MSEFVTICHAQVTRYLHGVTLSVGGQMIDNVVKPVFGFVGGCFLAALCGYGFVGAILEGQAEAERVGRAAHARNPIHVERTVDENGAVIETASFTVVRRGGR